MSGLAKTFDKSKTDITWGITLVLMFRSVGSILFGIAADRYGRKWPFIVNNALFVALELVSLSHHLIPFESPEIRPIAFSAGSCFRVGDATPDRPGVASSPLVGHDEAEPRQTAILWVRPVALALYQSAVGRANKRCETIATATREGTRSEADCRWLGDDLRLAVPPGLAKAGVRMRLHWGLGSDAIACLHDANQRLAQ